MAKDKTTFIKLDRNILEWRWYQDANTMRVFLHFLLKANIKEHDFETAQIPRGSLATSYPSLALELGLSIKSVRTALKHLIETGEVAVKRHPKFSVISIVNYDYYQTQTAVKRQSAGSQAAVEGQQYKNNKNEKNGKEIYSAFANVYLSGSEYQSLLSAYGEEQLSELIESLGEYKAASGREYKNDAAAIKTFARRQAQQQQQEEGSFEKNYG